MFYRPHNRVLTDVGTRSRTKQSHKDECDIHNILRQFQRTGIINHVQSQRPTYLDLPTDMDFQQSMNTILQAQEAFANLPSQVRDYYANDPERFLAALGNEAEHQRLREFGVLRTPDPAPSPAPVSEQS